MLKMLASASQRRFPSRLRPQAAFLLRGGLFLCKCGYK